MLVDRRSPKILVIKFILMVCALVVVLWVMRSLQNKTAQMNSIQSESVLAPTEEIEIPNVRIKTE